MRWCSCRGYWTRHGAACAQCTRFHVCFGSYSNSREGSQADSFQVYAYTSVCHRVLASCILLQVIPNPFLHILVFTLVQRYFGKSYILSFFDPRECVPGVEFSIGPLLPEIQERLLDSISFVVAKTPYRTTRGVIPVVRQLRSPSTPSTMEVTGPALTQLALHTLTTFDLQVYLMSSLYSRLLLTSLDELNFLATSHRNSR